jgi:hypothetical protein
MEFYEIYRLTEDLDTIQSFLLELIRHKRKIQLMGLSQVMIFDSYEATSEALTRIEVNLSKFSKAAKIINPVIGSKFDTTLEKSSIIKASAEISVSIKIAANSETLQLSGSPLGSVMGFISIFSKRNKDSLFSLGNAEIPIRDILIDIERLYPLITSVRDEMYSRTRDDFERFKPSNINTENVTVFVETALTIISESKGIPADTKNNIEEYLQDIKAELARDTPAWKKIVGALVIVSTLLSGLAVAPDALVNVRDALHEILGTSIDGITPTRSPKLDRLQSFEIAEKPSDDETQGL